MVSALTGAPPWVGVALLSAGVVLLVLRSTEAIEQALSLWAYLIDKGYGAICRGALLLFALPMLTLGVWKLRGARR